jgi:hypothetical protein
MCVSNHSRYQSVHTSVVPVFPPPPPVIISLPDDETCDANDDDVVCMAADRKGKDGT